MIEKNSAKNLLQTDIRNEEKREKYSHLQYEEIKEKIENHEITKKKYLVQQIQTLKASLDTLAKETPKYEYFSEPPKRDLS